MDEGLRDRFAAMPRGERIGVVALLVLLIGAASLWYVRSPHPRSSSPRRPRSSST